MQQLFYSLLFSWSYILQLHFSHNSSESEKVNKFDDVDIFTFIKVRLTV